MSTEPKFWDEKDSIASVLYANSNINQKVEVGGFVEFSNIESDNFVLDTKSSVFTIGNTSKYQIN